MTDGGQALYDDEEKTHIHVALSAGTAFALRDMAAVLELFTASGKMAHKPCLTQLLERIGSGELRVVEVKHEE